MILVHYPHHWCQTVDQPVILDIYVFFYYHLFFIKLCIMQLQVHCHPLLIQPDIQCLLDEIRLDIHR